MSNGLKIKISEAIPPLDGTMIAPFVKPENWGQLTPEQRRDLRMEHWVSGAGINFVSPEAEAAYKRRASLVRDALTIGQTPSRVPVYPLMGVYSIRRAGLTPKALFYDQWNDAALAHIQYFLDFEPDLGMFNMALSGQALELMDYKVMNWPGHGVPGEQSYQYNEVEFMKGDEYALLLKNPSDFLMRTVLPRMCPGLQGLSLMPDFSFEVPLGSTNFVLPFLNPAFLETLEKMKQSASLIASTIPAMMGILNGPQMMGYPQAYGAMNVAPFDYIGDVMRSTRGILMDMYRHKEELLEACDYYADVLSSSNIQNFGNSPLVFMPLHKGDDNFMSDKQFETFYWPSLKKVMLGLYEDGYIPAPFAEGAYNRRLEAISDFPIGGAQWLFDQTDMKNVAEKVGDKLPFMGNVPSSLTRTSTPEGMAAYCKNLIQTCGPTGNFILASGCQIDEAREENIKAMIASVME